MDGSGILSFLLNNPVSLSIVSAISGSLFTTIFLKNNTATKEFEKIKAGLFKEVASDLLESGNMTFSEFYKAKNFLAVAEKADEYHSKNQKTSEDKVYDFDWFFRFYEAVGNVGNEQMQEIWAKILSGEINTPGSISYRTIDVLKNMSQKDAELFEKICSFAISSEDNTFVPNYKAYLDEFHISYCDIMRLDEFGLINSSGALILNITVSSEMSVLFQNNKLLITAKSTQESDILRIKHFPLTSIGNELSQILMISNSDECFTTFARELSNNKTVIIELHSLISVFDNTYQIGDNDLLKE